MGGGVKKFKSRRTHREGQMSVSTGFHEGEVKFRMPLPGVGAATLTRQQAWDLAECLDLALDDQDTEPIK